MKVIYLSFIVISTCWDVGNSNETKNRSVYLTYHMDRFDSEITMSVNDSAIAVPPAVREILKFQWLIFILIWREWTKLKKQIPHNFIMSDAVMLQLKASLRPSSIYWYKSVGVLGYWGWIKKKSSPSIFRSLHCFRNTYPSLIYNCHWDTQRL